MQPEIVAHRGWDGKNSLEGILEALSRGHGAEFDIRDVGTDIKISHDPFGHYARHTFDELLWRLQKTDLLNKHALAINVKSAGLAPALQEIISSRKLTNYFCFDLASPDAAEYVGHGLRILGRWSPIEAFWCDGQVGTIYDGRGFLYSGNKMDQDSSLEEVSFLVCPSMHGLPVNEPTVVAKPTHILRRFYK